MGMSSQYTTEISRFLIRAGIDHRIEPVGNDTESREWRIVIE